MTETRILGPDDVEVLGSVAQGVFDGPVRPSLAAEFIADPRHHLAIVLDDGLVVGCASAVHYVHPDKPPELWVNEVGVAPTHRRKGLGRDLLEALFQLGRELGCGEAWVLTERGNEPASSLYRSAGGVEPDAETVMFSFRLDSSGPDQVS